MYNKVLRMNKNDVMIEALLSKATLIARQAIEDGRIAYSASSSKNEEFMVASLKEAAMNLGIDPSIIQHVRGHAFPDVLMDGYNIGIELKGTKTGDTFNGNSIIGSTLVSGLRKIYLYYWIDDVKKIGFCDYFESVVSAVVTHSPRFRLKVNTSSEECMFGETEGKVGSISEIIFSENGVNSDKIIEWMRAKANEAGQASWWMGDRSFINDLPTNQGLRINKSSLSFQEQREILEKGFLLFPELLSNRQDKFNAFISWAISLYGVVLNRDFFTAGGSTTSEFMGHHYTCSQILSKYLEFLLTVSPTTLSKDDLSTSFNQTIENISEYCEQYIEQFFSCFDRKNIHDSVSEQTELLGLMQTQIRNMIQSKITIL